MAAASAARKPVSAALIMALLAGIQTGCAASADAMRPGPTSLPDADPQLLAMLRRGASSDQATLVFVRPSVQGAGMLVTILDEEGEFVGSAESSSFFAVHLLAGKHRFVSYADTSSFLNTELAAGRVYLARISVVMGAMSPRAELLGSRGEAFAVDLEAVRDSEWLVPDKTLGRKLLERERKQAEAAERRAHAAELAATEEELAARRLRPQDGRAPGGAASPPR